MYNATRFMKDDILSFSGYPGVMYIPYIQNSESAGGSRYWRDVLHVIGTALHFSSGDVFKLVSHRNTKYAHRFSR